MFTVRHADAGDAAKIFTLYKAVGAAPIGIARAPEEVSVAYIENFMQQAAHAGIELVIDNPDNANEIIAEIHCHTPALNLLRHIMSDLTIAVHPSFQGRGLGKQIFTQLLEIITAGRPGILRVELYTQESNERAIALYKKLGFVAEGRFEKRVYSRQGVLEADIPMAWFNPSYLHIP
jgi:ribosomal protein S18 acetylase RimI-like enzyme